MGMMGVFKWLRKDIGYRDRNGRSLSTTQCALSNDSYRNALQTFIDRRRFSTTVLETTSQSSTDVKSVSLLTERSNDTDDASNIKDETPWTRNTNEFVVLDVPRVPASEIFEIGWVAGTEDRYLELVYAEWENTRISLKKYTHPDCRNAVKADMEVLTKIRHPNILMLMAMTQTEDHGLVSILEPVDCTLYNYMHEQGERISVRQIARFAGKLADALRHAHMRGYIHSAISSHCVYLASGDTVKLGGWELAVCMANSKPKREYEERLRTEIFRWQAPELFAGKSCKESDIYGLALLIWEMCTTRIPWSSCNMSDVQEQYMQVKCGIAINLCDFPPSINNLLQAGLQLDVAKRNLDLNRIRRLLQNLEIQHEYKDPVYVNELTSNNTEIARTFVVPVVEPTSVTNYRNVGSQTNNLAKQLIYPKSDTTSISTETYDSDIVAIARSTSVTHLTHNDHSNLCNDSKENKLRSVDKQRRKVNVPHSVVKKNYKLNSAAPGLSFNALKNSDHMKKYIPWNCTYRKVKVPKNLSESDYSSISALSSRITDSVDDEIVAGSARKNIQRLKETLASKREHFFYGTDSSVPDTCSRTENTLLSDIQSKDYEPHKPASHKTCLEPKYNKSPGQYDSSYMSTQTNRKAPYSQMPAQVKNAIIQPRVLNSDPQSFFESSLWKKEKEICISKMRKEDQNETQISTEDIKNVSMPLDLPERDGTYTVNTKSSGSIDVMLNNQKGRLHTDSITVSEQRHNSNDSSLKILKDALDRATEIICSTSPHNNMIASCMPSQSCDNFNNTMNKIETNESIFQQIYSLTSKDAADEIKIIEKPNDINETFLLNENKTTDTKTLEKNVACDSKTKSNESTFPTERTNKMTRSNVVNRLSELEEPIQDKSKKERKVNLDSGKFFSPTLIDEKYDFESDISFLLSRDKSCKTCNNKIALPRRRSLPAALCHLKVGNNSTLGRLPIRKADNNADNSVEDFYIDDDDLEMMNLNINMLLLNEDVIFDDMLFEDQTT